MKSAESDFSQEKLKDIMYTFYSVEEISAAKLKFMIYSRNLLKKGKIQIRNIKNYKI